MSEPEDFLSRWSRRKRQAADEIEDAAAAAEPSAPEHTADGDKPLDKEKRSTEANEPLFDPASLPSIESITAETDIRAFLAPGVPAELARAALRRAWAADPKIRDFVGLADYAWDFHAPGAMAGFGPLEMTDALRREIVGMLSRGQPQEGPIENSPPSPPEQAEQTPPESGADKVSAPAARGSRREVRETNQDEPRDYNDLMQCNDENIAAQNQSEKQDSPQSAARRGHGRALPKS